MGMQAKEFELYIEMNSGSTYRYTGDLALDIRGAIITTKKDGGDWASIRVGKVHLTFVLDNIGVMELREKTKKSTGMFH